MKNKSIFLMLGVLIVFGLTGCGLENIFNLETDSASTQAKKLPEMVINEPFLVTTVIGDYSVAINGARKTAKRSADTDVNPKQVIFLDYTYNNISYQKKYDMDFFLAQGDFVVVDDKGNNLEAYNIKDPNRMIQETPIGGSCSASIAYALETDSKTLTVTFVRGKNEIAEITVPIT
ncbi:DUF5067 domain-containing protein [Acetobacterium carbinolicum]|uniref:DUF5067 domain-containing protein n=1 Tax=Acetobacterium carbinolicum TaxID=52690 RepID=UPI0039BF2969